MRYVIALLAAVVVAACDIPAAAAPSSATLAPRLPAASASPVPSASPAPAAIDDVHVAKVRSAEEPAAPASVHFADPTHGWVGVADGLLGTDDSGATWTRELRAERITRIRALDAAHAWAFAADHVVYRTGDGQHWAAIPPTFPALRDVFFVSPNVGWAIAAPDPQPPFPSTVTSTLLHTTDGGVIWRTWSTQPMQSVCFVDEQNGWGANGTQAFRTRDGGLTWRRVLDAPLDEQRLGHFSAQIACSDLLTGWVQLTNGGAAMSHSGYLVYVSPPNGGATWRLAYGESYTLGSAVPGIEKGLGSYPSIVGALPGGGASFITCSPPVSRQAIVVRDASGERSFRFAGGCAVDGQVLDARTVTIITNDSQRATAIRTDDAGASWRVIYPTAGPPLSRFAKAGDALIGFARTGDPGGVFASRDDGRSWQRIGAIPTPDEYYPYYDISGPSFVDDERGWLVGMDNNLYATGDGGRTWNAVSTPYLADRGVARVEFTDALHGWVISSGLLHTSDGGTTWHRVSDAAAHTDLACVTTGCWLYLKDGSLAFVREDGSLTRIDVPELRTEAATLRLHASADRPTVIATWWPFDACHDFGLRSCARVITQAATGWDEVRVPIATEWPADVWWTGGTIWLRTSGHLYRSDDTGRSWSQVAS